MWRGEDIFVVINGEADRPIGCNEMRSYLDRLAGKLPAIKER